MVYPNEPKANAFDTIFISKDGRSFNNEPVSLKRKIGKDSLVIVTEIPGIDGNDHNPAVIRHTYILCKNSYSFKKEVKFVGQTIWILRNVYKFVRMKPCS